MSSFQKKLAYLSFSSQWTCFQLEGTEERIRYKKQERMTYFLSGRLLCPYLRLYLDGGKEQRRRRTSTVTSRHNGEVALA